MAADPRDQMRADRERHRAEARADQHSDDRDWRHDTLDLDPVLGGVVQGEVVRERTRGGALHAGRRVLRSATRSARSVPRRVPRRVPAGLVAGVLLLAGAGAVSAVASEGPLGWPSGVTQAPSAGTDAPGASVVVGGGGGAADEVDGGAAAPERVARGADGPAAPPGGAIAGRAGGPGTGPAAGPGAGPAGGPPAGPGATLESRPQERLP